MDRQLYSNICMTNLWVIALGAWLPDLTFATLFGYIAINLAMCLLTVLALTKGLGATTATTIAKKRYLPTLIGVGTLIAALTIGAKIWSAHATLLIVIPLTGALGICCAYALGKWAINAKEATTTVRATVATLLIGTASLAALAADHPQQLKISGDGTHIEYADGTPFFWMGDTGWLLPEKLDRSEAEFYLQNAAQAGFNVVQVQTLNGVPSYNIYGKTSHPSGWDFSDIGANDPYGYWDHFDYIIDTAAKNDIYIGMVCIWGGLVKSGKMDKDQAISYGKFLAERYKDKPNIIWIIGGDIRGDIKPEVWEALATTIKKHDPKHLMTFHPFGRTSSAQWWHNAKWLDFNMFQSGHRRYDQTKGDGDDNKNAATAEDNWRYVEQGLSLTPRKPIIDGEPSYEGIPQGLHDTTQPRWGAGDARRYAYWAVFAGAAGHTYGNNSVMQMKKPGHAGAYGATEAWYEAITNPGYNQMKHLRKLMETMPFAHRVADQSVLIGNYGERYDRAIATRGTDYLMVYTYTNQPLTVDMTKITGKTKKAWWYDPSTGTKEYIGEYANGHTTFSNPAPNHPGNDKVLIITDSAATYTDAL